MSSETDLIPAKPSQSSSRTWTIDDAARLYQVPAWGNGYFDIDADGDLLVRPMRSEEQQISLHDLVVDLRRRGYELPVLVRFSEILKDRLEALSGVFAQAIRAYGYQGGYRPVYPIKVNQQCDILEELLEFGSPLGLGLEAGSKPELLVALAHMDQAGGVIVCNGYKDAAYIETALLAQELGRTPILVVDRFEELELIIRTAKSLNLRPHIGVRSRLNAKGSGRWNESGGERSKFGLTASEILRLVDRLREAEMLDCLCLLHFHIGSQITEIRAIKAALRESARMYVELAQLGAKMGHIDVGGGLGVDYDGSKSLAESSVNYTMQEYANDVVDAVLQACDAASLQHPTIISESGRALAAHHSVLIFDVLGTHRIEIDDPPLAEAGASPHVTIRSLVEAYKSLGAENFREVFHDAQQLKEEANSLFSLGYLDLRGRSQAEDLHWAICLRVRSFARVSSGLPDEEQEGLEAALADTYYCNFSVFQSVPDSWAVDQLFPVMPIHRLDEEPTRFGSLADLTCDSDGKVNRFIDQGDTKNALELHQPDGAPYYLGMFLVGAYQETLGDLHNLFGDTNAVHVSVDQEHGYRIERVVEGDTVEEVLAYVQFEKRDMMRRVRRSAEQAVRDGGLSMEQSARLLRRFEEGLAGYTYLSRDQLERP